MKKSVTILITLLICFTLTYGQKRINKESVYQDKFTTEVNGQKEVRLRDGTRVDVLIEDYAIEVDFANKWAEGIGQALYYALSTNNRAGVLLIMENGDKDQKYLKRLMKVACSYGIKVWTIDVNFITKKVGCQCE